MDLDQRMIRVERCQATMQKEFSEMCQQMNKLAERHEESDKQQKELLESLCSYQKESTEYQKQTSAQLKEMSDLFQAWNNAKGFWNAAKFISAAVKIFGPILVGAGALWFAIKSGFKW